MRLSGHILLHCSIYGWSGWLEVTKVSSLYMPTGFGMSAPQDNNCHMQWKQNRPACQTHDTWFPFIRPAAYRMKLPRFLAVRLLDLLLVGAPFHSQGRVIVGGSTHHQRPAAPPLGPASLLGLRAAKGGGCGSGCRRGWPTQGRCWLYLGPWAGAMRPAGKGGGGSRWSAAICHVATARFEGAARHGHCHKVAEKFGRWACAAARVVWRWRVAMERQVGAACQRRTGKQQVKERWAPNSIKKPKTIHIPPASAAAMDYGGCRVPGKARKGSIFRRELHPSQFATATKHVRIKVTADRDRFHNQELWQAVRRTSMFVCGCVLHGRQAMIMHCVIAAV